ARVLRLIAHIHYDQGRYSLAIQNAQQALEHSAKTHDSLTMSYELNDIGRAYQRIGDPKLAIEYYQQGLYLVEKNKKMVGIFSNNIAMVLDDINDDTLALKYYERSLKISQELKDTAGIIISLNNMGVVYQQLKNSKKEEEFFQHALELNDKTKDVKLYGLTYDNIGSMWEGRGNFQKAFVYYQKELEYERKSGVKAQIIEALKSLANISIKMKNFQMALKYANEEFKLSEEVQSAELRASAARNLSIVFENLKQFEQAIRYLKVANIISDSLNSVERTKAVSNLASRYELTKKESEIKALNLEKQFQKSELQKESEIRKGLIIFAVVITILFIITIQQYLARKKANDLLVVWSRAIDQKNQELDNLNRIKDKIFSSIAHDVRGPLASLHGLLTLLNLKSLSPDEIQRITMELSARVNTTSSLLENLLNWSKNQITNAKANPVKTDLKKLVNDCISLYQNNALEKNIHLVNLIQESTYIYADEEMIRITLRNLISNAIKFTRNHGEVKIDSSRQDNILCISVSDSGVGIPQEDLKKLFSLDAYTTLGTAKEKGTGLGLILCKEFIEKNGGEISVASENGIGSTFKFTVPAA
ncbi:MAG TPA: hypothetical protein DGG95_03875, partial [Cytophagales bacterium]|nr:hypothetical protein [Cytophagales bacterium]